MSTTDNTLPYTTASVKSADGTIIGYRQMGHGEGLVLVHGGMQASQNFMKLAAALSDEFTIYIPDRRGRGLSGPHGANFTIQREVEDMEALLNQNGAHNVFGLSSGAVVSLQSALMLPDHIHRLALYEPPLSINGSTPMQWLKRYDREIAEGNLAGAMVSVMKGTGDTSLFSRLPRFLLEPMLRLGISADGEEVKEGDVSIKALIPTMHFDGQMVARTDGTLDSFSAVRADVLLLGGSRSAGYLKFTLDQLSEILPHVQRVEFQGLDHLAADNSGKPERVAEELRRFFSPSRLKG